MYPNQHTYTDGILCCYGIATVEISNFCGIQCATEPERTAANGEPTKRHLVYTHSQMAE